MTEYGTELLRRQLNGKFWKMKRKHNSKEKEDRKEKGVAETRCGLRGFGVFVVFCFSFCHATGQVNGNSRFSNGICMGNERILI